MMGPNDTETESRSSPLARPARAVGRLWRDALSIYYTNTPVWRWLKSGALLFFGFFCWAASNLLLSNVPEWGWLTYPMAYGFALILWGPLTHMVVVPLIIRLRRTADHPVARTFARQGSKINLSVFFAIVLVLGTVPVGPVTLDFGAALGDDDSPSVDAEIECEAADGEVACLVEASGTVDHVVATSGDRELDRDDASPYELTFQDDELEEVVGQKQFVIELRDEDGETIRRYVRTLPDVRA